MEEIIETVTETITGSGDALPPREYTAEEMSQQTTDFLLYFVNSMKELTEEQKAKMRSNILEKAFNPEAFMEQFSKPKTKVVEPTSAQDLITLVVMIVLIVGVLGKLAI